MLPLKTVFMGTPEIASQSLLNILKLQKDGIVALKSVYTKPPSWNVRKKEFIVSPVEKIARENRINVRTPKTFKDSSEETDFLKSLVPDIIIVVAFGLILPAEILNIPKYGILNLHPSILPELRGPSPIHYTILNMTKFGGVSIMAMDTGIDTGPVAAQQRIAIDKNENYSSLYSKLSLSGALLLSEVIKTVYKFRINMFESGFPQNKIEESDSRVSGLTALIKQEELYVDFSMDEPAVIYAKIRAFSEVGGAFFVFKNKNVKIMEAELLVDGECAEIKNEIKKEREGPKSPAFDYGDYAVRFPGDYKREIEKLQPEIVPGTIAAANKSGLVISTVRNGIYIRLIKLKPEGRNIMNYNDFINGFRIKQGDICR